MSVYHRIVCDTCGRDGYESKKIAHSAGSIRRGLIKLGWLTALQAGQDMCPECLALQLEKLKAVDVPRHLL